MLDLSQKYKYIPLIVPQSAAATVTGSDVDIEGYHDDALAVMSLGALGGTTETYIGTVETSADGGSTHATAATFGTVTGTNGDNKSAAAKVSLAGKNRVRGVLTMSGTGPGLISMGILVRPATEGSAVNSATPA